MKLKTKRLTVRDPRMSDAADLASNMNNLNVVKWLLVVPYPYKLKDALWYINKHKDDWRKKKRENYAFLIALRENDKVIGGIGIHKIDYRQGKGDIGYWLGENYWKKGYGSEALETLIDFAFRKLKLRKLEAEVFAGNPSSGKLLEKYGFKYEGTRKKSVVCKADGKIHDAMLYGLLKDEWKGKYK